MGPLGGTRCGTYAANWMYGTRMIILDIQTYPGGDVPGLRLTDKDVGLLRRVDCDILAQGLIGLIEYSYHQGIPPIRVVQLQITSGLTMLGPKQF
jgi:hypothetical protein